MQNQALIRMKKKEKLLSDQVTNTLEKRGTIKDCSFLFPQNTVYLYHKKGASSLPVVVAQPDKKLANRTPKRILCVCVVSQGFSTGGRWPL